MYISRENIAVCGGQGGFILTKWYVNFLYNFITISLAFSFILTKWYVNLSPVFTSLRKVFVLY